MFYTCAGVVKKLILLSHLSIIKNIGIIALTPQLRAYGLDRFAESKP